MTRPDDISLNVADLLKPDASISLDLVTLSDGRRFVRVELEHALEDGTVLLDAGMARAAASAFLNLASKLEAPQ